jgi:hypothetical protein
MLSGGALSNFSVMAMGVYCTCRLDRHATDDPGLPRLRDLQKKAATPDARR